MTNGRFDINDVMAVMMGGSLPQEPVAQGRIVALTDRKMVIGLPTKDSILKDETVYELLQEQSTGRIYLEEKGKSYIDWRNSYNDISAEILQSGSHLILTENEMKQFEEKRVEEIEKKEAR